MSITLHKSGTLVHGSLSGELTIVDASAIHNELFAELDGEVSLVIDAANVTRIDASVAQLFLFASHCARDCRVESRSNAWDDALALFGQGSLLAAP